MPRARRPAGAVLLLAAALAALALPQAGGAQVRRCTLPGGERIYTDRSCESLDAVETRPAIDFSDGSGGEGGRPGQAGGCARSRQALVQEIATAIDAGDTDRLVRSYHWPGLSHRAGYAVAERLDAIARRPLLDIVEVRAPPATAETIAPGGPDPAPSSATARTATTATAALPGRPPPPLHARLPAPAAGPVTGLRIEQVLADGVTPSSTSFGLRRHMDCWWITF